MREVHDETLKMSDHPYKPSNRHIQIWLREVDDGFYMFLTRLYPVLGDMMHEIHNFIMKQVTFGGFKL